MSSKPNTFCSKKLAVNHLPYIFYNFKVIVAYATDKYTSMIEINFLTRIKYTKTIIVTEFGTLIRMIIIIKKWIF